MKYLKRFNEELSPRIYKSAARKLDKLGHSDRAKELKDWSNKIESDLNLKRWERNVNQYSKFGKVKLNILNEETGKKMTEDFYLDISIDRDSFEDSYLFEGTLEETLGDDEGYFWLPIGIIPATKEVIEKCEEVMPEPEMIGNGFYWGMSISLKFKIENSTIKMIGYELDDYDPAISGKVSFADRSSANKFKTTLKKMFTDPTFGYPSGYDDIPDFYEMFYNIFGGEFGLTTDYGLSPETIGDFINSLSVNAMYKSI